MPDPLPTPFERELSEKIQEAWERPSGTIWAAAARVIERKLGWPDGTVGLISVTDSGVKNNRPLSVGLITQPRQLLIIPVSDEVGLEVRAAGDHRSHSEDEAPVTVGLAEPTPADGGEVLWAGSQISISVDGLGRGAEVAKHFPLVEEVVTRPLVPFGAPVDGSGEPWLIVATEGSSQVALRRHEANSSVESIKPGDRVLLCDSPRESSSQRRRGRRRRALDERDSLHRSAHGGDLRPQFRSLSCLRALVMSNSSVQPPSAERPSWRVLIQAGGSCFKALRRATAMRRGSAITSDPHTERNLRSEGGRPGRLCATAERGQYRRRRAVFGVGRIGERSDASSEAEIFFDLIRADSTTVELGRRRWRPSHNKTNAIVKGPPDFFTRLLEVIGLSSIDNACDPGPGRTHFSSIFEDVINAAGVDPGIG